MYRTFSRNIEQTMTALSGKRGFDERRGFAAVDAFFKNGSDVTTSDALNVAPANTTAMSKNSRLGVGATSTSDGNSSNLKPSTHREQRILEIGSHRRRKRQGYGDEDDEETANSPVNNYDESDGDDEKGRTAIAKDKEKTPLLSIDIAPPLLEPQRKKKKGKKERKLQLSNTLVDNIQETEDIKNTELVPIDSKPIANEDPGTATDEALNTKAHRRRRKKIRSKQKNIRKDHRDVKPVHVMEKGRPLTAETRAKLQAPKIIQSPLDHPL
jgi:hypothetical protein